MLKRTVPDLPRSIALLLAIALTCSARAGAEPATAPGSAAPTRSVESEGSAAQADEAPVSEAPARGSAVAESGPATRKSTGLPTALQDRTFDVFLDTREIGAHRYHFSGSPMDFRVESTASFEVKIAFVKVFGYEHEAVEEWREGCMISVESSTETNKDYEVTGERTPDGFSVQTLDGGQTYDTACAWGFAYWNPALRTRDQLINPQDGKLFDVRFRALAPQPLSIGERSVRARAWALNSVDDDTLDIVLYYDEQDRWIGLDSTVAGGRVLRYRTASSDPYFPS